jgi:hypothetical protein
VEKVVQMRVYVGSAFVEQAVEENEKSNTLRKGCARSVLGAELKIFDLDDLQYQYTHFIPSNE